KITNFCGADAVNSLVINSNGDLYKCWSDIGFVDRKIGNINDNFSGNTSMYYDYMLYDPTEDEECKKCKLLPICMGGCPYQRVVNKKKGCNRFKENMDDFMKKIVKIRLKQVVGE
ncbi:MAG: SPASM domain-containing protein, partial [Finegoldia magna]|nr:SPASM domain-containing protein [Finegoldia magna]